MNYERPAAIPEESLPQAGDPAYQHVLDIYAGETNKVASIWRDFADADLAYKPHPKSSTVAEILKHQLLSERRFFAEFLDSPEPAPGDVLPGETSIEVYTRRFVELARPRLVFLAGRDAAWWLGTTRFFDVDRQRIWIFWRRVLHTAHHRTQLTQYLRLWTSPCLQPMVQRRMSLGLEPTQPLQLRRRAEGKLGGPIEQRSTSFDILFVKVELCESNGNYCHQVALAVLT